MINIPKVKLGVVAVSRDCFPIDLSERRRTALMQALAARGVEAVEIQATVENAAGDKCQRCWKVLPTVNGEGLCPRCAKVLTPLV